uniref:Uncharacterized protein n=1 Tax=Glossina austeni TaxID=7395 RepID=A0A1A9VF22_GLOAU
MRRKWMKTAGWSRLYANWCFGDFISADILLNNADHFLPNDELTIVFEIEEVNIVNISDESKKIKSKMFEDELSKDFGNLFVKEKRSYVTLAVGEHALKDHKSILTGKLIPGLGFEMERIQFSYLRLNSRFDIHITHVMGTQRWKDMIKASPHLIAELLQAFPQQVQESMIIFMSCLGSIRLSRRARSMILQRRV